MKANPMGDIMDLDSEGDNPTDQVALGNGLKSGTNLNNLQESLRAKSAPQRTKDQTEHLVDSESKSFLGEDTGLTSLTVQDKRRQGLYGSEAFGVTNQTTSLSGPFQFQTVPNIRGSCINQPAPARPVKALKTSPGAYPGEISSSHALATGGKSTPRTGSILKGKDDSVNLVQDDSLPEKPQNSMHVDARTLKNDKAGTDLDRDEKGHLYPRHIPIWRSSPHIANDNGHHTRERAPIPAVENSRKKRKQAVLNNDILPSPAFIWKGSADPGFTVFQGLLLFPELCFLLVAHLPLRDLISLYSISRDFHTIIDTRFTTTCLTIANNRAPESARIFRFRMFSHLCRPDPANRIPHPDPVKAAIHQPRTIPSFQWVAFVLFREKVVHELMAVFAENGVPLPEKCEGALKRMWLIMDIPDNARRIGLVHNRRIIPDTDLYFMFYFFVRLDMICHDPLAASKHDGLRKLMLSQRDGLLSVLQVLKRAKWKRQADLLIAWVHHACEVTAAHDEEEETFDAISFGAETIFGVPVKLAGLGKYEYWGQRGAIKRVLPSNGQKQRYAQLMRPDQLVMREAVRRGLKFSKVALKSVLHGYTDDKTLSSVSARAWPRRIPEWNNEEYEVDDLVGGVTALDVAHGGDPLLDLGESQLGTPLIVKSDPVNDGSSITARQMREEEDRFLDLCVHFCGTEFAKIGKDDPVSREELDLLP